MIIREIKCGQTLFKIRDAQIIITCKLFVSPCSVLNIGQYNVRQDLRFDYFRDRAW